MSPTRWPTVRACCAAVLAMNAGGNFFQPTVLADVTTAMKVAREETFGPVAPLFRFETEAEAIAMANDTEFGLAAYFFTRDVARAGA